MIELPHNVIIRNVLPLLKVVLLALPLPPLLYLIYLLNPLDYPLLLPRPANPLTKLLHRIPTQTLSQLPVIISIVMRRLVTDRLKDPHFGEFLADGPDLVKLSAGDDLAHEGHLLGGTADVLPHHLLNGFDPSESTRVDTPMGERGTQRG